MKVEVFALLKEYFDKQFFVPDLVEDINSLKDYLGQQNPEATRILSSCRFAVNDEFIDTSYKFKQNDSISIIPPSSGG
ncbi:MoaD/ThiS family protein [Desertivirga xinjiangensis]|uniref:MoaD/ThiS family protein n=1 Tax=Desertivirga xinjiangensis TaxID=539206 RepID=UPI00210B5951|nr:MoaD/ThiS family protein [Pedobacter xinjiangensis]